MEMDLTIPSERTITLLAGLFKIKPHELVDGTTYPQAKAEKLPLTTCTYTSLELDLAVLENDLRWIERLRNASPLDLAQSVNVVKEQWKKNLACWLESELDTQERDRVQQAQQRLEAVFTAKSAG
jgi:hypothetical protein